ncbi:MAG: YceI family protein [Bacteroidales bacterium]
MKLNNLIITVLLICTTGFIKAQELTWKFDREHSKIQFKSVYLGISNVYGQFHQYSGTITTKTTDFANTAVNVVIKAESIDTDITMRDNHLRSEDFIHAEKYPEITFNSHSFETTGDSLFRMTGDLTIRGVTNTESFDARYKGLVEKEGKLRAAFEVTGVINRFDYNVDWNENFLRGFVVSEELDIICDVMLIAEKP